jgi:hypothetical protein
LLRTVVRPAAAALHATAARVVETVFGTRAVRVWIETPADAKGAAPND